MSGGGGGSSSGGGPAFEDGPVDCANLRFQTFLASAKANLIPLLKKGDLLEIQAMGRRGPLLVLNPLGNPVGSITHERQLALLDCIEQGFQFKAEVLSIAQGAVKVEIRCASNGGPK